MGLDMCLHNSIVIQTTLMSKVSSNALIKVRSNPNALIRERSHPISLKHVSLWCFFYLILTYTHIKIHGMIKEK